MSDTHKFLSKQELELQEVNYIFSLRAERDELQEQLNTAKKALTEIDRSRYDMQFRRDRNPNIARQALAAIGGDDE